MSVALAEPYDLEIISSAASCRHCGSTLDAVFCDLGMQPLANGLLTAEQVEGPQRYYPLRPMVCRECLLVQLPNIVQPEEMFEQYLYFSGQSSTWVRHCQELAAMLTCRFAPTRVLEIASNDGTLLRCFDDSVNVIGVDPAENIADQYQDGPMTVCAYWGRKTATGYDGLFEARDLIVAMNVLAHVPDLDDFVGGIEVALAPDGVAVFEFPWIANLIADKQWDTIYHEHYSYLSLLAAQRVLGRRALRVFDVEEIATHGGSLRLYCCHNDSRAHLTTASVPRILRTEAARGLHHIDTYEDFQAVPPAERLKALDVLTASDKVTVGYGAPAKGVTWLNYLGVGAETFRFIVDSTPAKQGKFTPGGRVPILPPDALDAQVERIVVLPWNWLEEIRRKIDRDCPWQPEVIARPFL